MTERHSDTQRQATPRTDEFYGDRKDGVYRNVIVEKAVEHSRQLERELAEAKAKLHSWAVEMNIAGVTDGADNPRHAIAKLKAARPSIEAQSERVAQITAHRAVGNQEQDAASGKLAGYCAVCQVPWPCAYAGTPPSATGAQMTQEQVLALINMPQPNYSQEQHNYLMMLLEKANRHSAAGSEHKEKP